MTSRRFTSARVRRRVRVVAGLLVLAGAGLPARAADPAESGMSSARDGYWTVTSRGAVFSSGDAGLFGSTAAMALSRPIVGMAATPTGAGYWLVASDGGIFAFGDAAFHGSTGAIALNKPITGMAATPTGAGYWLVASDGGIFAFGDASFHGSTGAMRLNRPIVGMAATPSGDGYWLVASDGGIFSFGDAAFHGSTGAIVLNKPITGMAATPTGAGYWLVASDGGVFTFGDAVFSGSPAGSAGEVAAMVPTSSGHGYWVAERNGRTWPFGDAPVADRRGPRTEVDPVVGITRLPARKSLSVLSLPGGGSTTGPAPAPAPAPATTPPAASSAGDDWSAMSAYWPAAPPPGAVPPGTNGKPDADVWPQCAGFGMVRQDDAIGNGGGEISGLVTSPRYPGALWAIRDSGHTPSVLAIRLDSAGIRTMLRDVPVPGAENIDWESLNYTVGPDGRGRLWAVSSGQGGKPASIYEILEPDPDHDTSATLVGTYPYAYPDERSNTEASFVDGDRIVLVKKSYPTSKLYRFDAPLRPGATNVPTFVGNVVGAKSTSEMKLSPDRQLLMSASHDMLWIHRSKDGSGSLESFLDTDPACAAHAWPESIDNIEAGVVLGRSSALELLFISESRNTYRVSVKTP